MSNLTKLIQRRRAVQLAFTMGLALLFTTALLWGLGRVTLAHATPTATVRYVDGNSGSDSSDCSNSASPCATIQYAINQSVPGDEIRAAQGTYIETIDIPITLTLNGGYEAAGWTRDIAANPTIIDANGADASVVNIGPVSVTIEGFTIQGANHTSDNGGGFSIYGATAIISATIIQNNSATGSTEGETFGGGGLWFEGNGVNVSLINSSLLTNTAGDSGGGAISNHGTGILTLDNVEVRGNSTSGPGGGLSLWDGVTVTITNSQIISNTAAGGAGGGIFLFSSSMNIYNSTVSYNKADGPTDVNGGGIAVFYSALLLTGSQMRGNQAIAANFSSGGNAVMAWNSAITLTDTVIQDNQVGNSAIVLFGPTTFAFTNALITDNNGDAVGSDEGPVSGTMMNVTIANNSGFGLQLTPGTVTITNSILWGNGAGDNGCGGCFFYYSDVGNAVSGANNISSDPRFVGSGDYHLLPDSPAIDAGTASGAPTTDLDGKPRDAAPDMGTYEWRGFRIFLPLTLKNFGP